MKNKGWNELRRRAGKRVLYSLAISLFLLWLSFGLYFLLQVHSVQKNYLYPYPYQDTVREYSSVYGVESDLVAAVIKAESNFREKALSPRGAMGLMQIMPATARWISGQLGERYDKNSMWEPEKNIRYGVWYLGELQEEFQGNEVLFLAAYNAGRGNVREWMKIYGWDMDFDRPEEIPFRETREYVRKVLKNRSKYRELYDE